MTATRLIVPPKQLDPGAGGALLTRMVRSKMHAWNLLDAGSERPLARQAGVN
jgi:hypothetical protein